MALFLVCGLLAMEVVAEESGAEAEFLFDEDALVQEEAAPAKAAAKKAAPAKAATKAAAAESSVGARSWQSRELASDDATKQLSATASNQDAQTKQQLAKIAEQQKKALLKGHEMNKVARKEMRAAGTQGAQASVGQAISAMTSHVKKMAARAAALAAKSISKATKFNHNNAAAERKKWN